MRARLKALEDEDFDALPGRAYAASFLREYAEFLGLDGQRFVDEFDARFPEAELPMAPVTRVGPPRRGRLHLWSVALATTLLVLIVWQLGREENSEPRAAAAGGTSRASAEAVAPTRA
jgi:cytoskeletal protein RodZ